MSWTGWSVETCIQWVKWQVRHQDDLNLPTKWALSVGGCQAKARMGGRPSYRPDDWVGWKDTNTEDDEEEPELAAWVIGYYFAKSAKGPITLVHRATGLRVELPDVEDVELLEDPASGTTLQAKDFDPELCYNVFLDAGKAQGPPKRSLCCKVSVSYPLLSWPPTENPNPPNPLA